MANPCDYFFNGKKLTHDQFRKELKELPMSEIVEMFPSIKDEGISKIGWTTGEQQNERYDLSKQVDKIEIVKRDGVDSYRAKTYKDGKILNDQDYISFKELEGMFGKEIAKGVSEGKTSFEGEGLKVGGKGMKGFYGSPTEGSLGIVGNVAKSLFKQEPKTVKINTGDFKDTPPSISKSPDGQKFGVTNPFPNEEGKVFDNKQDAMNYLRELNIRYEKALKSGEFSNSTQHSIDITPELKQQVSEGLPLFMASAPKEDFAEALNEYDNLIKNPKGTTEYIKKFGLEKIKKIKDITSNFGTYIAALEKSNYITKKIC
jgi:hypothetical protein